MTRLHRVPSILASSATAAGLALVLASCGGSAPDSGAAPAPAATSSLTATSTPSSSAPSETSSTSATPNAAPVVISIKNFMFTVPASVAPGAMIMIKNEDSQAHTVTSKTGGFDVKVDGSGTAMLTAPKAAGSYELTCDFHANMKSNLVVK